MSPDRRADRIALAATTALALAVYATSLRNGFVYDDVGVILDRPDVQSLSNWKQLLTSGWRPNALYRPLSKFSLALDWAISGGIPWYFHLVNVILHALVTAGVWVLARRWIGLVGASVAGVLFAVHPVHVEAVANVVGRTEVLAAGFALLAALLYARLALYLRPGFDVADLLLGEILDGLNQPGRAIAAYEAVPASSPLRWSAELRVATDLDDLGRTDEAIARLNRMASERTDRADALIALGDILRGRGRWSEAVDAYDRALSRVDVRNRRLWRPLYARGISLERSKHWKRAEKDFLAALDLVPDQPFVLNYLGYSWVDQGLNLKKAQEMIKKAVKLRPKDGYIVDSLGWVYYRLGNYADAVREMERATELRPEDPVINDHLGDAYWRVGRKTEARFQWLRALGLKPTADNEAMIRKKLKAGLKPPANTPKTPGNGD